MNAAMTNDMMLIALRLAHFSGKISQLECAPSITETEMPNVVLMVLKAVPSSPKQSLYPGGYANTLYVNLNLH